MRKYEGKIHSVSVYSDPDCPPNTLYMMKEPNTAFNPKTDIFVPLSPKRNNGVIIPIKEEPLDLTKEEWEEVYKELK